MQRFVLAFFLLLNCAAGWAQEGWNAYGLGTQSCGKYVESRRTPNPSYDSHVLQWFYGFVSAFNYYGPNPQVAQKIDPDAVLVYLDKYCRENSLAGTALGAMELIKTLRK